MSNLLIDERPLTLLPSLISLVGFERAAILQQIHFAVNQPRSGQVLEDGEKYVWNTYEEWREHFPFWTANAIQKHFTKLEELGYLISRKPQAKFGKHTKYYRIDYSKLTGDIDVASEALSTLRPVDQLDNAPQALSIEKGTETTKTETSTERVAADAAPPAPQFLPSAPQAENLPLAPAPKSPHQECVDYLIERVGRPHPFERQMASLKRMLTAGVSPEEIKGALDQAILDSEMGQKFTPLFTAIENSVIARLMLRGGVTFQVPTDMTFPSPEAFQ